MTEIETTRMQRGLPDDWQIDVVGLTNEEAMSVSAFVSQIIMARRGSFENYFGGTGTVTSDRTVPAIFVPDGSTGYDPNPMSNEEVASILTKRAQPPLTRPEPGNRFSGLDLTESDE